MAALLPLLCLSACETTHGVRTVFVGSYDFTPVERRTIERIAADAAREAREYLPGLASKLTLRVEHGTRVIQELGALGEVAPPDYIVWTVDTKRPEGVVKIAESYLRVALLHEFHHLVRLGVLPGLTPMDRIVSEGMATAFERDFGKWTSPWSQYPPEAQSWVDTLLALPSDDERSTWMEQQSERRLGYKAGTFIVDRAMKKLGKTSAELVTTPTSDVIAAFR